MKSSTGNAIALLVVVALLIGLYVQWNVRLSLSRQLDELQGVVESLRDEVRALKVTVGGTDEPRGAATTSSGNVEPGMPGSSAENGAASGGAGTGASTTGALEYSEEPVDVVLAIAADGSLKLDEREVAMDDLQAELKRLLQARPAMHLIVKPDNGVATDDVTACLDTAGKAGIHNVALVTASTDEQPNGE